MIMQTEREMDMPARQVAPDEATERGRSTDGHGSYGRGIYAGHSTFGLDFCTLGSYGCGIYAGHHTLGRGDATRGSYGRGIYAGHSTYDRDFRRKDSYARGLEQPPAHVARRNTRAAPQRTQL
jgi:hypothetical protein